MDTNNHKPQRTEPATASETHLTSTSTPATPPNAGGTAPAQSATGGMAKSMPLVVNLDLAPVSPPVLEYVGPAAPRTPDLPAPTPDNPLADFVEPFAAFLEEEGGRTEDTIKSIVARLKALATGQPTNLWPDFVRVPVRKLRKKHIMGFQRCLNQAVMPLMGEPYSDDTKNATNSALRQLLEFLCDELEIISDETFARLAGKLTWRSTGSRPFTPPSNQQIELMRQYLARRHAGRDRRFAQIPIMFEVYLAFGPRQGMVAKLKVKHVDLVNSRVHLTLNKQKKNKLPPVLKLLLPERLKRMLAEHIERFGLKPDEFLFTVRDINHSLKSAAQAAGLTNWYHHAFRKLVATRMVEVGVPIPIIAALLGHKDSGATILKNYWNYSQSALDAAAIKYHASWNGAPSTTPADLLQLKARLVLMIERLGNCPPQVLQPVAEMLLRLDGHLLAGNYDQALAEIAPPKTVTLPEAATAQVPNLPEFVPDDIRTAVAANVLYLQLRHGWGTHELESKLGLYSNALYNLRRGRGLNRATLQVLANEFNVPVGYFSDSSNPKADLALIRRNLQYLADRFGAANLPLPAVMAKVLHGTDLPCGLILRRLTEQFKFLTIEKLMDVDLAADPTIAAIVARARQDRTEAKQAIAARIQIYYWLHNANGMRLAARTQIKASQVHAYAAGRDLPPRGNQEKLARELGVTVEELLVPVELPTAPEIGRRIRGWLGEMDLSIPAAAAKMNTSRKEFQDVALGDRLPSAGQLRKLSALLGRPMAEILGMKLPDPANSANSVVLPDSPKRD